MILVSMTFETWSEDAVSAGETDDRGFIFENAGYEFRELVNVIKRDGFIHASCSHGVPRWLSTDSEVDYLTGEDTTKSLHPARDARSQRYWEKACRAAGIIK